MSSKKKAKTAGRGKVVRAWFWYERGAVRPSKPSAHRPLAEHDRPTDYALLGCGGSKSGWVLCEVRVVTPTRKARP